MHHWDLHHCRSQVWKQIFPACSQSYLHGQDLGGLGVVDQNKPLVGSSHLPTADPSPGKLPAPGTNPGAHWDLGGTLLRSLGQQEGCTQRLPMHQIPLNLLFHAVKGTFLPLLPWRREAARSARPHRVASELPSTAGTSAPISSCLSSACSSCLGPCPHADVQRAVV